MQMDSKHMACAVWDPYNLGHLVAGIVQNFFVSFNKMYIGVKCLG
jgi:hypothetical protein